MDDPLSLRSDLTRLDAACGLAILLREICENVRIVTFSDQVRSIPNHRGFGLSTDIQSSQPHRSTRLGMAISSMSRHSADRLIVITDEQATDKIPDISNPSLLYMINIATNQNGVGYGKWIHINGWSESVVTYIQRMEQNCVPRETHTMRELSS